MLYNTCVGFIFLGLKMFLNMQHSLGKLTYKLKVSFLSGICQPTGQHGRFSNFFFYFAVFKLSLCFKPILCLD